MQNMKKIRLFAGLFLAVAMCTPALFAQGQIPAKLTLNDGRSIQGKVRWMPIGKKYVLTRSMPGGQSTTIELSLSKVKAVEVQKPPKLFPAIKAVKAGKGAAAIPVLKDIVKNYAMLRWDEMAARYLAEAQLATGDAAGAVKTCEGLIDVKEELAYIGEVAPIYWQALLKTGKTAKLSSLISKAISQGDASVSAHALIMRGDMLMEKREYTNALKDGYLRVVVLYGNVKDVQPEALYKGAKAFEALSQNTNAEKLRSELRSKFPRSSYAKKL